MLNVSYLLPSPPFHRDVLGIIFTVIMVIGPVFLLVIVPGLVILLKIDPLFGLFSFIPSANLATTILLISARFLFTTYEFAVLIRWFSFSLMQLFLVLIIGNTGLKLLYEIAKHPKKFRHLPQKPEPVEHNENTLQMAIWQLFIVRLVIIQRRILLQTRFWSYNMGANIFILVSLGVILWSLTNYTLIVMTAILPIEIILVAIALEVVYVFLYGTLIPYVTSIEHGSRLLNKEFRIALMSHKLGRRYINTLTTAKISTPFFSFRKAVIILLFRIPFEATVNLVLTFPPEQ